MYFGVDQFLSNGINKFRYKLLYTQYSHFRNKKDLGGPQPPFGKSATMLKGVGAYFGFSGRGSKFCIILEIGVSSKYYFLIDRTIDGVSQDISGLGVWQHGLELKIAVGYPFHLK